ncbi:MAG: twin-arginine translocation signal domain-containing protein, partial [Chloroflexi bacterium]|nr:twin-arginine translocation signal domain-containing protein [Chloroflexota bacterium]
MDTNMKRRDFLKISALAGVAVVAAACQPAAPTAAPEAEPTKAPEKTEPTKAPEKTEPTAAPEAVGFQGDLEFYAQAYTPTSALENPDPKAPKREAMAIYAKEWMDLNPGIE